MPNEAILLISAQDETADSIMMTLEAGGFNARQVPFSAIDEILAGGEKPDLIFVNPDTAQTRGLEACGKIHTTPPFDSVPIIVVTTFEGTVEPRYTSLYGIVDFLKIPVGAADVLEKAERVLGQNDFVAEPDAVEEMAPRKKEAPSLDEKILEMLGTSSAEEPGKDRESPLAVSTGEKVKTHTNRKWYLVIAGLLLAIAAAIGGYTMLGNPNPLVPQKSKPATPAVAQKPAVPVPGPEQKAVEQPAAKEPDKAARPEKPSTAESVAAPAAAQPEAKTTVAAPAPQQKSQQGPQASQQAPQPEKKGPPEQQQATKPSAAVPPVKPAAAGKIIHAVQVGAFKDQSNADALAKELRDSGHDVTVHARAEQGGALLYRVLIGAFDDRRKAWAAAEDFQLLEDRKATVFSYQSDR